MPTSIQSSTNKEIVQTKHEVQILSKVTDPKNLHLINKIIGCIRKLVNAQKDHLGYGASKELLKSFKIVSIISIPKYLNTLQKSSSKFFQKPLTIQVDSALSMIKASSKLGDVSVSVVKGLNSIKLVGSEVVAFVSPISQVTGILNLAGLFLCLKSTIETFNWSRNLPLDEGIETDSLDKEPDFKQLKDRLDKIKNEVSRNDALAKKHFSLGGKELSKVILKIEVVVAKVEAFQNLAKEAKDKGDIYNQGNFLNQAQKHQELVHQSIRSLVGRVSVNNWSNGLSLSCAITGFVVLGGAFAITPAMATFGVVLTITGIAQNIFMESSGIELLQKLNDSLTLADIPEQQKTKTPSRITIEEISEGEVTKKSKRNAKADKAITHKSISSNQQKTHLGKKTQKTVSKDKHAYNDLSKKAVKSARNESTIKTKKPTKVVANTRTAKKKNWQASVTTSRNPEKIQITIPIDIIQ